MTIPQGYKQTELGIIPEDWEYKPIRSLCRLFGRIGFRGYTKADLVQKGEGAITLSPSDIINYTLQFSNCDYISWGKYYESPEIMVFEGDIIFCKTASIGKCAIVQKLPEKTTINPQFVVLKDFKCCNNWMYYQLIDNRFQQTLLGITGGSTIPTMSQEKLYEQLIPTPSDITEQRAIAEALSDVDGLIAALNKKIAKKRLLKQGAMQQLLTGKKRLPCFTDEWVDTPIGEGVRFQVGYPFQSQYFTSDRIGKRLVKNRDLKSDDQIVFYNGEYDYQFIVHNGDILIGMDGDFLPYKWDKGIALLNQRVGRLLPTKKWDLSFVMYALIEPLQKLQDGTGATTVKHLSHNDIEQMVLCIPQNYEEQQAIATILSDMDKEIANLEAQRDKYRLLKSGMMQKLLIGQIRLVKQQAKIIPLGVEVPAVREIPVATHIIAGHIVNRSHKSRGWGRTKLQKSLHLIGYCMQLNLGNEYIRNTAGPDDQQLMDYIDQKFRQYRHVNKVCEKLPDGKTHYSYTPTPMIQDVEVAYEKYSKGLREQVDALIDKLNTMDLAGAEILSTLYAVWNNRIIKREQITDDLLIADFYAWSTHKADFEEARVKRALDYMRKENIIPIGWGKYIDKR